LFLIIQRCFRTLHLLFFSRPRCHSRFALPLPLCWWCGVVVHLYLLLLSPSSCLHRPLGWALWSSWLLLSRDVLGQWWLSSSSVRTGDSVVVCDGWSSWLLLSRVVLVWWWLSSSSVRTGLSRRLRRMGAMVIVAVVIACHVRVVVVFIVR